MAGTSTPSPGSRSGGPARGGAFGSAGSAAPDVAPGTIGRGGANSRRFALRNALLSPDGSRLYVPGSDGLSVLNTKDLSMAAFYLPGTPVDQVALSPDGRRLYAMSGQLGRLYRLDAATGDTLGESDAGGPFVALLHVVTNP